MHRYYTEKQVVPWLVREITSILCTVISLLIFIYQRYHNQTKKQSSLQSIYQLWLRTTDARHHLQALERKPTSTSLLLAEEKRTDVP